jgi:hypothetical protein
MLARLQGADRDTGRRFSLDDQVAKLHQLIAGGAPGATFNIVVPRDAEAIVEALKMFRGSRF